MAANGTTNMSDKYTTANLLQQVQIVPKNQSFFNIWINRASTV